MGAGMLFSFRFKVYTLHPGGRSSRRYSAPMLIGEIARRTGVPPGTIRFYERHELIAAAPRSASGCRLYPKRTIDEIAFIKRAQRIGFSLDEIREILKLGRGGRMPCSRVVAACEAHLLEIDRRMAELRAFRHRFTSTLKLARAECGFTPEGFCRAIIAAGGADAPR